MKTWMFYSYKGGSGRTVAAANIAAALAKLGKRVLIVDMDFEAPGLHTVFRVEDTKKFGNKLGLQNYLRGSLDLRDLRKEIIIDLASEEGLPEHFQLGKNSCLLYLMAAPRTSEIFASVADPDARMTDLINGLGDQEKLDYIILDAASGIREASTLSIHVSSNMMIFFRWSRQHLEGTMRILNIMKDMRALENEGIYRPFKLVASAAPREEEFNQLDEVLAVALRAGKAEMLERFRNLFGEEGELFDEIPEITELKWREAVMVFNRNDTPFERIASKMLSV